MSTTTVQPTDGFVIDDSAPRWQMSPLTKRRWANFKANKRGYFSLWAISIMMVLSFFAEFIANDKPLIMGYNGSLYVPVLVSYPETEFGGVFETEARYTSHAVQDLIDAGDGWMIWPPIPFDYSSINYDLQVPAPGPHLPEDEEVVGLISALRGEVEGLVRVVHSLAEAEALRPGEILVSSITDVGWTPYFAIIAGLVTDVGSAVSHGAVVAREYGLPAVLNTGHGTEVLTTGDRVRLDGDTGIVEILDPVNSA